MSQPTTITGQPFGNLNVVARAGSAPSDGQLLLRCLCTCSNTRITKSHNLTTGRVRACHDCARLAAFTLAASIRHLTSADFKRDWRKWHDQFTPKQAAAFAAKLRDWADGLPVRFIPDAVRADLVAEVMTMWLARTAEAMRKGCARLKYANLTEHILALLADKSLPVGLHNALHEELLELMEGNRANLFHPDVMRVALPLALDRKRQARQAKGKLPVLHRRMRRCCRRMQRPSRARPTSLPICLNPKIRRMSYTPCSINSARSCRIKLRAATSVGARLPPSGYTCPRS
jgi:hypothetical protein